MRLKATFDAGLCRLALESAARCAECETEGAAIMVTALVTVAE